VIGLQLVGVHHPKTPAWLRREGDDQVSRLRHSVHETTLGVTSLPNAGGVGGVVIRPPYGSSCANRHSCDAFGRPART
jgi:hypothetical protein